VDENEVLLEVKKSYFPSQCYRGRRGAVDYGDGRKFNLNLATLSDLEAKSLTLQPDAGISISELSAPELGVDRQSGLEKSAPKMKQP
jgi:hypothetical protein